MNLHPEALDRIVPADPCEAVRARYAEFATEERPGDPWAVPFDARRAGPRAFVIVTACQLVACALAVAGVWTVLS